MHSEGPGRSRPVAELEMMKLGRHMKVHQRESCDSFHGLTKAMAATRLVSVDLWELFELGVDISDKPKSFAAGSSQIWLGAPCVWIGTSIRKSTREQASQKKTKVLQEF